MPSARSRPVPRLHDDRPTRIVAFVDVPLPHPFPIVLDLRDADVLVVGGGRIAARKARALTEAGAVITAVAPTFDAGFPLVAHRIHRTYEAEDVQGRMFVVTATGFGAVDARVSDDARAAGTWVNAADDPEHCSCYLPAVLRHGPVAISVSTGGASPALASWIRDRIAEVIGPEVGRAAESLAARRAEVHERGESTEDVDWRPVIESAIAEAVDQDR